MMHYHVTFHSMILSDLFQVKTPEYASVWSQQAETRVTFNGRMQWRWLHDYLKVYLLTSVKRCEIKIINWYDILKSCDKFVSYAFYSTFQLWLTLSEKHLVSRGVDWKKAEKFCFNEWSNPDDDELGLQIVRVSYLRCFQNDKRHWLIQSINSFSLTIYVYLLFSP